MIIETTLLPEELWEKILLKLNDPQDLASCLNTCQLFRNILLPSKNNWLFKATIAHLLSYLKVKDVLNCRKICKSWRDGVDNYLESLPFPNNSSANQIYNYWFFVYEFGCTNTRPKLDAESESFLEKMRNHPTNPLIGRAISLYEAEWTGINGDEDLVQPNRSWKFLFEFMETFGTHIHHLQYFPSQLEATETSKYRAKFITYLFHQCPNLKSLKFHPGSSFNGRKSENLADFLEMPSLELISAFQYQILSDQIWKHLFRKYSGQLKTLEMGLCKPMLDFEWNRLTTLDLGFIATAEEFKLMGGLRMPNLKRLLICFAWNNGHSCFVVKNGFKFLLESLNALPSTLSVVNLCIYAMQLEDDPETHDEFEDELVAPSNIKTMELRISLQLFGKDKPFDYSFLRRFRDLESIHLTQEMFQQYGWSGRTEGDVEIHDYLYNGKMYESNI